MSYGFNESNIKINTYEELMNYVTEEDIMTHYFGEWEPNKHYIDQHFKEETSASFYISYYNNKLKWRRFGIYNTPRDPVEFVMFKFGLNFQQAIDKILKDLCESKEVSKLSKESITNLRAQAVDEFKMSIVLRNWQQYDLDYWLQYDGFSIERLEKFYITAAKEYWVNGKRIHISNPKDPLYCYNHNYETGLNSFTAYRPYADIEENKNKRPEYQRHISYKFRKYLTKDHIMNLNTLLNSYKRDKLPVFITSSLKDIVALDCAGFDAVALHTEEGVITEDLIKILQQYYPYIYLAYDNDETGVKQSIKAFNRYKDYDIKYWNVPKSCISCKDPSDVLKNESLEVLKNTIYEKLQRDKINI